MTKVFVSLLLVLAAAECVAHAPERIKLCGRALVRMAVSTCGSSRLRRSIRDVDPGQHQLAPQWDQDAAAATETEEGNKDVLSVAPPPYHLTSRSRRAAGRISDICCHKGCSKRDLIKFC